MPNYLASYDLKETSPDPHPIFLKRAIAYGWSCWILASNNLWYRLPNTTLVGAFDNLVVAGNKLEAARVATQNELGRAVTMSKWIVVDYGFARFDSDQRQSA
ncbi:hypothetical protein NLM27_25240 [Bradyrhizobium sp. CCGB12]|uniref:hypothetical protein n=1 Tax=Bradyrhizobium sp. CCGB12 TaxID=2949632 RepID=UPI0020B43D8D|nr:hypothetical protein [Bradyrhizobium sp. CCGB12]MCP3392097.1 hypothetical protein [Bradyrhizobium sp. CCGB12]